MASSTIFAKGISSMADTMHGDIRSLYLEVIVPRASWIHSLLPKMMRQITTERCRNDFH
jgi:hypothetical protein